MVSTIQETMILDYLDIQISIGAKVSQTERARQEDFQSWVRDDIMA